MCLALQAAPMVGTEHGAAMQTLGEAVSVHRGRVQACPREPGTQSMHPQCPSTLSTSSAQDLHTCATCKGLYGRQGSGDTGLGGRRESQGDPKAMHKTQGACSAPALDRWKSLPQAGREGGIRGLCYITSDVH